MKRALKRRAFFAQNCLKKAENNQRKSNEIKEIKRKLM